MVPDPQGSLGLLAVPIDVLRDQEAERVSRLPLEQISKCRQKKKKNLKYGFKSLTEVNVKLYRVRYNNFAQLGDGKTSLCAKKKRSLFY